MLLQAVALALCATCIAAQSANPSGLSIVSGAASAPTIRSSSSSARNSIAAPHSSSVGASSHSGSSLPAGALPTAKPAKIVFTRALDLTTFSEQPLPSFASARQLVEAPAYTDSRFPWHEYWPGFEPGNENEIQPKVEDPVSPGVMFDLNLTNPNTVPFFDLRDDSWFLPSTNELSPSTLANPAAQFLQPGFNISLFSTPASRALAQNITSQLFALFNATNKSDSDASCQTCMKSLKLAQSLARQAPWEAVDTMIRLCNIYGFTPYSGETCEQVYAPATLGSVLTQVLALSEYDYGFDAQAQCASGSLKYQCKTPPVTPYYPTPSELMPTPKPANATAPATKPGTPRLKVVHISDIHLDPRYAVGSEGNCSDYLCCRTYSTNTKLHSTDRNASVPSPRFGWFNCDSPYSLVLSALQAIPDMTGVGDAGPDFTAFTGDIVSHDNDNQLSTTFDNYEEGVIYTLIRNYLTGVNNTRKVYPTISNHDGRYGGGYNIPNAYRPSYLQNLYDIDYNTLTGLWKKFGWIDADTAAAAREVYSMYSVKTEFGLHIVHFNANLYYSGNIWNIVNSSNVDNSGAYRWLADALQSIEDMGERAWVIVHEPSGYDGAASLANPSDMFAAIIERYSPHVIAAVLGGHNHYAGISRPLCLTDSVKDETYTHYRNNGTDISADGALVQTWLAGSITPLTSQNPRFRLYEVDSETFDIVDAHTWYTDGIEWIYEYNTRLSYNGNISWPDYAPLNATWWYHVVQQMNTTRPDMVELFQLHQSGYSIRTPNCTSTACVNAKACYLSSASQAQAAKCPSGYSSTQDGS